MSQSLQQGLYRIFSGLDPTPPIPRWVSRAPIEDLSLLPKRVYRLPEGVQPSGMWIIVPKDKGEYELQVLHSPVGPDHSKKVMAFLIREMAPTPLRWKLIPVDSTPNPNDFIVESVDGLGVWTLSQENTPFGNPIELKPLTDKSKPQPEQVFNILRIDRE